MSEFVQSTTHIFKRVLLMSKFSASVYEDSEEFRDIAVSDMTETMNVMQ